MKRELAIKNYCLIFLLAASCFHNRSAAQSRSLFNGRNLEGWHIDVPEMDTNSNLKNPFVVRNGLLVSLGTPLGHLISDSLFQNFRLTVEYRFAGKPGNCGILVHTSTPRVLYKMFPKSIEVQMEHRNAGDFWCIGEDISVVDMEKRRGSKANWSTTGDKGRNIKNLTDNSEKPAGEWNSIVIECLERNIRIWVNGILVNDGFNCTTNRGQIALQAEASEVEFKKLAVEPIEKLSQ